MVAQTKTLLRAGAALLVAGGLLFALAATVLFGSVSLPGVASAKSVAQAAIQAQTCSVHTYTTDSPKESAQAFGPKVAGSYTAAAIPAIVKELDNRRACDIPAGDNSGDAYLLASHYAMWSAQGLTKEKVDLTSASINAFAASLIADQSKWQAAEKELEALESASSASIGSIPAGSWTMYMAQSSGNVSVNVGGNTIGNGTMIVFTHGDKVVRYRLDCGFQPVIPPAPPAPQAPSTPSTPSYPATPTTPTTPTTPPQTCADHFGPGWTGPGYVGGRWICKDPATDDPNAQGHNRPGGGGQAPPVTTGPSAPAAGNPPATNTPPTAPAPGKPSTAPNPGQTAKPDPQPAPPPETSAPAPSDPAQGCTPPPGKTTC